MSEDTGQHYRKEYKGVKLDVARIARVYEITDSMQFGILKKSLRAGTAHKSLKQDIKDIRTACDRWLEIIEEDEELEALKMPIPTGKGDFS